MKKIEKLRKLAESDALGGFGFDDDGVDDTPHQNDPLDPFRKLTGGSVVKIFSKGVIRADDREIKLELIANQKKYLGSLNTRIATRLGTKGRKLYGLRIIDPSRGTVAAYECNSSGEKTGRSVSGEMVVLKF